MAEETAGIGEAGALVNRATAPQDMAITKGIIQSQNNALRKAQVEARKLAAIDAMKEKQSKYLSQVGIGKYKNQIIQDEANSDAPKTIAELATVSGNPQEEYRVINEHLQRERNREIKDNYLEDLKPKIGVISLKGAKEAVEKGKGEEWFNRQSELVKPYIKDADGIIKAPNIKEIPLYKIWETEAAKVGKEIVDIAILGDGKKSFTLQALDGEIMNSALNLYQDPTYIANLRFDENFQKEYNKVKPKTEQELDELEKTYTFDKLKNVAYKDTRIQSMFGAEELRKRTQNKTTNEITTNITNKTNGIYTFTPKSNGGIKIETFGTGTPPPNLFVDKEKGTIMIPTDIEPIRNSDGTFVVKGNLYKIGQEDYKNDLKGVGAEVTIPNVTEAELKAAFTLQEKRYYKGLVLDQLKSPKVVAPSGAKKAEGAKGTPKKLNIKASTNTLNMFGVDTNAVKSSKPK
jgi:hypothetical protein